MLGAAVRGDLKCLWVFHHDLRESAWPEAEVVAALKALDCLIFQATNANGVSPHAQLVLPSATYAESEGTYTNFQGRVQRFRKALDPLGESLPDWEILSRVAQALGLGVRPARAEECFKALAQSVPAFAGLTYRSLGDTGQQVSA